MAAGKEDTEAKRTRGQFLEPHEQNSAEFPADDPAKRE